MIDNAVTVKLDARDFVKELNGIIAEIKASRKPNAKERWALRVSKILKCCKPLEFPHKVQITKDRLIMLEQFNASKVRLWRWP